ncbi:MAG TPA: protoglobin domain-containing protein [Kofleriaceae bacterium]|nr:protoglobin domain-containing protein [Kofleriaceae bacterium]
MAETFLQELRRYVGFGPADEEALRLLAPHAAPHLPEIAVAFYERLAEHEEARAVLSGPNHVTRLRGKLERWMRELLDGPWDEEYFERRARIGRTHVRIGLPQRYMFGAMNLIRVSLMGIASAAFHADRDRHMQVAAALHRIVDIELAIMLETYRAAFVEKVQAAERKEKLQLERQLAISQARYDEVVEKGEALIATIDRAGGIVLFNAKCEAVTGLSRAEAAGRPWLELFAPGADRDQVARMQEEVLSGGSGATYEGPVEGASGARRVRWTFTTLPGRAEPVVCAIGLDVTEEHELAVRTQRAEHLASLGAMAAGLAHEIRNPLNAAHLQLSVARRRLARVGDQAGVLQPIDLAGGEITRLAALVEDFLQFARPQPLRLATGDLRATAESTIALVAPEAATAGVTLELAPGEPVWAELDRERMTQVLLNLLRNGLEAAGDGGRVRVAVEPTAAGARLTVEDDGRGLSADDPIFEPFFTTKERGTGLGLAIAHRIVTDHGGTIELDSRPGRTVFAVLLPAAARPSAAAGTPGARAEEHAE